MGEGQSRLSQQHELYKAQLNEMRRQEALNEEQRRRQADEYHAQILAAQKRSAEKEAELQQNLRRIEEEQLKRAKEMSQVSFQEEIKKEYDARIKEKNDELAALRNDSIIEMERLRRNQEEDNKKHLEDLNKIHEKILQQEENNNEVVKKLLEERHAEAKERNDQIVAANRQMHEATMKMITSRSETTAITMGILNNVVAKNSLERDANTVKQKIDAMRQTISRMEERRRMIFDWMVEYDLKKSKKGIKTIISHVRADKDETAQPFLKSITDDSSILDSQIKEAIALLSNAMFAPDLMEKAQAPLNFAHGKISDLFDEIANLKVAMAKTPRDMNLDGIKKCLKELDLAMANIPSMMAQTPNEYIQEEMKKLEVKEKEFFAGMGNAISDNLSNLPLAIDNS